MNIDNLRLELIVPNVSLEIPLKHWGQFELAIAYLAGDAESQPLGSGFGDVQLGFRARLFSQAGKRPAPAFNFEVVADFYIWELSRAWGLRR